MSVEDGKKINNVFTLKQKQIDSLKLTLDSAKFKHNEYMIISGQRLQNMYNSWAFEHYGRKSEIDSLNVRLEANKRIYMENERALKNQARNATIFSMIAAFILMIMSVGG